MAYSKQFKVQAMKLVTDRGYLPTVAARELGMPMNTLNQWLTKAGWKTPDKKVQEQRVCEEVMAGTLSDDPAVLKVKVRELEKRVKRLEMEKDILKKATAFFAQEHP